MASEDEIQAAEARLGLSLPPSFRSYLIGSSDLPGEHGLRLLPADEIDRFDRREPESVAAWMEGYQSVPASRGENRLPDDPTDPATMPAEQLGGTIVVSTTEDARVLLLNPATIDAAGEWEAWDFAHWYPGAYRYPSFRHLVTALTEE